MSVESRQMLVVDDDVDFCLALARAMGRRGFDVATAHDHGSALALARLRAPRYAVVDLRLGQESGLLLLKELRQLSPTIRIVVLSGYASIATAVEAIKLGAVHYLAKPADPADIEDCLHRDEPEAHSSLSPAPMSLRRVEWEHLNRVLHDHGGNISATAQALNMHRRTLQRKLSKYPVRC